jgi:hypothetical protein
MSGYILRGADRDPDWIRDMQKGSFREDVLSAIAGYTSELEVLSSYKLCHHMLYLK